VQSKRPDYRAFVRNTDKILTPLLYTVVPHTLDAPTTYHTQNGTLIRCKLMQMAMKREIDYFNANRIRVHSRAKHVLTELNCVTAINIYINAAPGRLRWTNAPPFCVTSNQNFQLQSVPSVSQLPVGEPFSFVHFIFAHRFCLSLTGFHSLVNFFNSFR
jgi:hypothetical protein